DLVHHARAVSADRHGELEVLAVRDRAHHLQIGGLSQRVAKAVDLAAPAQRLGQGGCFLGGRDPTGDGGVDAHDIPRAARQVVGASWNVRVCTSPEVTATSSASASVLYAAMC